MKKYNIDVSQMNITPTEKDWGYSIAFTDEVLKLKNTLGEQYFEYFPPDEKKLPEKIAIINYLKLKEKTGLQILDIGTGCGHFPLLCNSLGHFAYGTEIPESIDLLTGLYQTYNLDVSNLRIERQKSFVLPQKYNLITMLRTVFDTDWDSNDWNFFKENIFEYLEPGGEVFIKTNIKAIPNLVTSIEPIFGNRLQGWNSLTFHIKK